MAADLGNYWLSEFIIENGGKIDLQDSEGKTPIYIAAENGHTKVLEKLCEWCPNGINIEIFKKKNTPVIAAALGK